MSLQTERSAIEAYFKSLWGTTTPIGYDQHAFTPVVDSVMLDIKPAGVFQGTIGGVANRIDHAGVLIVTIYVAGGNGSHVIRGYAETIEAMFMGQIIDVNGAQITAPSAAFIRWAPNDNYPSIQPAAASPPMLTATVVAPFVRYEYL